MKKKFTIVVADDDLDDQTLIKDSLKDCKVDIKVVLVNDGVQLMDFLLKRQAYKYNMEIPDLILLDLNMPLMDGFQALKQIGLHKSLTGIPIYVITTSRAKREKEIALDLGASGFYSKGASSKDIRAIVKQICNDCFEESSDEAAE